MRLEARGAHERGTRFKPLGVLRRRRRPELWQLLAAGTVDGLVMWGLLEAVRSRLGIRYPDARDLPPGLDPTTATAREALASMREQRAAAELRLEESGDRRRLSIAGSAVTAGFVVLSTATGGWSPGRGLLGLRLVRADGRPLRPARVAVREAAPIARSVLADRAGRAFLSSARARVALRLGVAVAAWTAGVRDPHYRSLGDRLAGTRIVRRR